MKKKSALTLTLLPALAATIALTSCATFRGMPSHGGGKRFDEEQRVVTAAIRHAAEKMDFSKIKSRRVALEVTSLETSGTGQAFYPGLGSVTAGWEDTTEDQIFPHSAGGTNSKAKDNTKDRDVNKLTPSYQFNPSMKANNNITRQDVTYLQRVLEMRLRHDGFQIVPPELADVQIVVLVDALGTNLSRKDYGVAYDDDLGASCEMTYYAINSEDQKVIAAAKAVASKSDYLERNIRFTPFSGHRRSVGTFLGKIAPLPTKASGSFHGGRRSAARVYTNPTKKRLNELSQDAAVAIEANDKLTAKKLIGQIKKIDPNFADLPELQQALKQL